MIWRSIELMTLLDLLILGIVGYAFLRLLSARHTQQLREFNKGSNLACVGLGLIALFYLADLLTMHVLPTVISMERSMSAMHELHLNYRWIISLLGIGLIVSGLISNRSTSLQIISISHEAERRLQQELEKLRTTEQALYDSEAQLRSIIDNMPAEVHLKDMDGRYVQVNRKFEDWFGLFAEEVKGKTPQEVHPKDFAAAAEKHDRFVRETGQEMQREERMFLEDGERTLLSCKFPVENNAGRMIGTGAIVTDITDRKRMEEALRQSEALFRTTIDQMPAAVSLKKPDGNYLVVNQTFQEWFNPENQELSVNTVRELVPESHADEILAMEQVVRDTQTPLTTEMEIPLADGTWRKALIHKFPLFNAEGSLSAIGTIETDNTELREAEARLHQSQKMETVGQLTGGVAHDFNNLLGVVQGNIELARETCADVTAARHLETAICAVERGAKLTHQLLAFSRKQQLHPEPVNPRKLLDGMADLLRQAVGETIQITISTDPDSWNSMVDPHQLENAILNLALNAKDAMPNGGNLLIAVANVRADHSNSVNEIELVQGEYIQITVTDSGTGMTRETLEKACEPFFTTKEVGSGTGLGLSMIHGFINQSGGRIKLSSELGKGTTVSLYLPATTHAAQSRPESQTEDEHLKGQRERVLLVEDHKDLRELIAGMLTNLGYSVTSTSRAQDALDQLRADNKYSLILTDIVLPGGMDGYELVRVAKERFPHLPVVFMSGYNQGALIDKAKISNSPELLQKPFRKADLARAIHRAMGASIPIKTRPNIPQRYPL